MVGREAPAAARNRFAILEVLRARLPEGSVVLEVASGTGEHALWFSLALPAVVWQPSDRDPEALESIAAWRAEAGPGLLAPVLLDAASDAWPVENADAVVSINMVHIAPWAATEGLFAGAARVGAAMVLLYGPFREAGVALAESNAAFEASLRERDAAWGLREVSAVADTAARCGFQLAERVEMPANNLSLVFRRG